MELLSADWNHWPNDLSRAEIAETAARLGVAGLELGVYDTAVELAPDRMSEWNELASTNGIGVRALLYSMPTEGWPEGGLAGPSSRERFLQEMEDLLETASGLGLGVVGLWPGADPEDADRNQFAQLLSELSTLANDRGVSIAIEPKPETLIATPEDVAIVSQMVARPESIGLLLDTGHEFAAGRDPAAIVESLDVELLHVHLGDSDGDPDADLPPGRIHPLDGFFDTLATHGYSGAMSPDAYGAVEAGVVTGAEALEETVLCLSNYREKQTR